MSAIGIITGGIYNTCCGGGIGTGFGGGAPNIVELAEKQKFSVKVDKVYFRDTKKKDIGLKILIKQITMGDI